MVLLLLLCVVCFLTILGIITVFGYAKYVKFARMLRQLDAFSSALPSREPASAKPASKTIVDAMARLGELVPSSPQEILFKKKELTAAGFRSDSAVYVLGGLKIIAVVVFLLIGFLLRGMVSNPTLHMAMPLLGGALGFVLPGLVLSRLISRRQEQIRYGLADALDMLVVCSEAGCALDQAILNVSREFKLVHAALSDEFALMNMEILAGASRADALRNFAARTGEEEAKKLVAILIQTDKFGTSIADALRTQADFMRTKRRQAAEERAGKVGVKLIFPIFFFCMPALGVVVMGPAILQLMTGLLPSLSGSR